MTASHNHRAPRPEVVTALLEHRRIYDRIHRDGLRGTPEGHWINEAFVLRLWALLDAHHCVGVGPEYMARPGVSDHAIHVTLCKALRQEIGHGTGNVSSKKSLALQRRLT